MAAVFNLIKGNVVRIFISSGGTVMPIDAVRFIKNHSTGQFGAALAKAALEAGHEVIYFKAVDAMTPFSMNLDAHAARHEITSLHEKVETLTQFYCRHHQQYSEWCFTDYADYAQQIKPLLIETQPDLVYLAAAVSDFCVKQTHSGKIRSASELSLTLTSTPKVIHLVRSWLPRAYLVGFKLLVNVTESELVMEATKSIQDHDLDVVIANDLASIKNGAHEVLLVERDHRYQLYKHPVAKDIMSVITNRLSSS